MQNGNVVMVKGATGKEKEDSDNTLRRKMMAEMRRWLRRQGVSVSRVTLEDESAPGVSSSSALPYAKC